MTLCEASKEKHLTPEQWEQRRSNRINQIAAEVAEHEKEFDMSAVAEEKPKAATGVSFIVNTAEFRSMVDTAAKIVKGRSPQPILQYLLVTAENDVLSVCSTSLDKGILVKSHQVQIESVGRVLINAEVLRGVLHYIPDDAVRVGESNGSVTIKTEDSVKTLRTMPANDFPPQDFGHRGSKISIPGKTYADLIESVFYSAPTEHTQSVACPPVVHLEWSKGVLEACGASERSLCVTRTDIGGSSVGNVDIPAAVAKSAAEMFLDSDEVCISEEGNHIIFEDGERFLKAVRLERPAPGYKAIMFGREAAKTKILLPREDFLSAIKQSGCLANEQTRALFFDVSPSKPMVISASSGGGDDKSVFHCASEGESVRFAVNADLISRTLATCEYETVEMLLNGRDRPIGFICPEDSGKHYFATVAPLDL